MFPAWPAQPAAAHLPRPYSQRTPRVPEVPGLGERPFLPIPHTAGTAAADSAKGGPGRADRAAPSTPLQASPGLQGNQSAPLGSPQAPPSQNKEPQCGLARGQPAWRLPLVIPQARPGPLGRWGQADELGGDSTECWRRKCRPDRQQRPAPASAPPPPPQQPPRPPTHCRAAGLRGCGWSPPSQPREDLAPGAAPVGHGPGLLGLQLPTPKAAPRAADSDHCSVGTASRQRSQLGPQTPSPVSAPGLGPHL